MESLNGRWIFQSAMAPGKWKLWAPETPSLPLRLVSFVPYKGSLRLGCPRSFCLPEPVRSR